MDAPMIMIWLFSMVLLIMMLGVNFGKVNDNLLKLDEVMTKQDLQEFKEDIIEALSEVKKDNG